MAVIAHTIKGKGVSFMEGHYFWHTRIIKPEEFAIAMVDLGEPLVGGGRRHDDAADGAPDARGLRRDGRRARQRTIRGS